jgi:hypothetical protein
LLLLPKVYLYVISGDILARIWCCCVGIEVSDTIGIIGLNMFELS